MGLGGFKCVDLSANVFPFLVTNVAYLISASRLTERAERANMALDSAMRGTLIKFILSRNSAPRGFMPSAGRG